MTEASLQVIRSFFKMITIGGKVIDPHDGLSLMDYLSHSVSYILFIKKIIALACF